MWTLFSTVFVASLLGSLHCVGMCGPFALLAGTGDGRTAKWTPTLAYSIGRLISYSLVGVLFGSLGMVLNQSLAWSRWQQVATAVAGGLMIVVGLIALARHLGCQIRLPKFAGPLERLLGRVVRRARTMSPLRRAWMVGLASSLMPCGWLYVFALAAAGTASPLWGGLVMAVFWAGTLPIMVILGIGWGQLTAKLSHAWRAQVPLAMALLVVFIGLFTVFFRSPVSLAPMIAQQAPQDSPGKEDVAPPTTASDRNTSSRPQTLHIPTSLEASVEQIKAVNQHTLPCCQAGHKPAIAPTPASEVAMNTANEQADAETSEAVGNENPPDNQTIPHRPTQEVADAKRSK